MYVLSDKRRLYYNGVVSFNTIFFSNQFLEAILLRGRGLDTEYIYFPHKNIIYFCLNSPTAGQRPCSSFFNYIND